METVRRQGPVETLIYIAHLMKQPIFVGTPDGDKADRMWLFKGGEIYQITPEVLRSLGIDDKKKNKEK